MSLLGTVKAQLLRKTGTNRVGEPIYGETIDVAIDIVHIKRSIAATSVRTDSSASRGAAEERGAEAKLLFPAATRPRNGDRVVLDEVLLRVENVETRYDVFGRVDHYETSLVLWDDRASDD